MKKLKIKHSLSGLIDSIPSDIWEGDMFTITTPDGLNYDLELDPNTGGLTIRGSRRLSIMPTASNQIVVKNA